MNELINKYFEEIKSFHPTTISDLEDFRLRFLSKKGIIAELFDQFRQLPKEAKKDTGRLLNDLKNAAVSRYEQFQILLKPAASSSSKISDL